MLNIQDFLSMSGSVDEMIALEDIYCEISEAFAFIIDEWDCILRDRSYTADDQKNFTEVYHGENLGIF